MDHAIWKYDLSMGENKLTLPEGAIVLSAKEQFNKIVLYMAVPPHPKETDIEVCRKFNCFQTGTEIDNFPRDFRFIDTVLLNGGKYVVHVCENQYKSEEGE